MAAAPTLQGLPVELLTLFRKWYHAARSVFASGLEYSIIRVYGHIQAEVSKGKWSYDSGNRGLMQRNTRVCGLRFEGRRWDELTSQQYEDAVTEAEEDGERREMVGLAGSNQSPFHSTDVTREKCLKRWSALLGGSLAYSKYLK